MLTGPGTIMIKLIRTLCLLSASLSLIAMTLITVVDVCARYLFNRPIYGSGEMIQYLLAIAVFSGLFIVNQEKGHVSVTLLEGLFVKYIPKTYDFVFHLVSLLGLMGINAILAWQFFDYLQYPETSIVLGIPLNGVIALMLIFGMLSLVGALQALVLGVRRHLHGQTTASHHGSDQEAV